MFNMKTPAIGRRQALAQLGGLGSLLVAPFACAGTLRQESSFEAIQLAAAWGKLGQFHIGLLNISLAASQSLQVQSKLEVPTRAHALLPLPEGSVLAVARRPGDWLVRWHPGSRKKSEWLWIEPSRAFNGHVIASPDGQRIYTTETNLETGAALVGVRDVRSLEKIEEWPTHGIDAHELAWDPSVSSQIKQGRAHATMPTLIVANGGVPTSPETGRIKRDLDTMASSLVRLCGHSGELLGQWHLTDPLLSLRHLAWLPQTSLLGIALQSEHNDLSAKQAAPVLALFDGQSLRTFDAPSEIAALSRGYGGSMAATGRGWAVSCPRANGIATFTSDGRWLGLIPLTDAYALAAHGAQLLISGEDRALIAVKDSAITSHPYGDELKDVRMDNHWYAVAAAHPYLVVGRP
jgi:hypothetical protein